MAGRDFFQYEGVNPIIPQNGGLFISRGDGMHPDRVINSYEIILVEKGILGIGEDEADYKLKAGEYLILYPGRRHRGILPYGPDLRFYWLHFQLEEGATFPTKPYGKLGDRERAIQLFRWYLKDQEEGRRPSSDILVIHLFHEISVQSDREEKSEATSHLVLKADEIIAADYHLPLSTGTIASRLQCNPDYLGRLYKRQCCRTLTEALNEFRIKKAVSLLLNTGKSIRTIAYECGYSDPVYFRRVFKGREGVTPGIYRSSYSRVHINSD